jgi:hypothetical protein
MALHATFDAAHFASRSVASASHTRREPHDLAPIFWSIAFPACLAFWAAVAYGIHSAL